MSLDIDLLLCLTEDNGLLLGLGILQLLSCHLPGGFHRLLSGLHPLPRSGLRLFSGLPLSMLRLLSGLLSTLLLLTGLLLSRSGLRLFSPSLLSGLRLLSELILLLLSGLFPILGGDRRGDLDGERLLLRGGELEE